MAATTTAEASADTGNRALRLRGAVIRVSMGLAAALSGAACHAAEWKLTPSIDFREVYTDNVRLQSPGLEQSAYITQVSPGLSIAAKGDRLRLKAHYAMQNLYYPDLENSTRTSHLLDATASAMLARNLFFLDGTANISQQVVNPFAQQASNNYNLTDNRTEVRTYSLSPYLRHRLHDMANAELRYTRDSVSFSQKNGASGDADSVQFNLTSGAAFKTLSWGVEYSDQKIHSRQFAPLEFETGKANLTYHLSPQLGLTGSAGYEHNSFARLGGNSGGASWTAGLVWTPSERTRVNLSAGHRYFGRTYGLTASYRARMSVFSAGYTEDATTTRGQFLLPATTDTAAFLNQLWKTSVPDDGARQQMVDNFIRDTGLSPSLAQPVNTFTNRVFLQKSLQASAAVTGVRNTFLLTLFNTSREALSDGMTDTLLLGNGNPALLDNTRQTGVTALWNWKISPRTNASFSASQSRVVSLSTGVRDTNRTLRATISRQLQAKLKASLEFRKQQKDTNQATGNFQENAVTLFIMLGF